MIGFSVVCTCLKMAEKNTSHLSLVEARKKCKENYSCFTQIECTERMILSPNYIGRLREGVEEELTKKLMKFCEKLRGVIVGYDRIQLLNRNGNIVEEAPFLHFKVKVNYIVFQPQINKKLIGVVNKLGFHHIGCLVHGYFNASIDTNPRFQNGHCIDNLKLGSSFMFRVVSLESLNGVLLITGVVDDKSLRKTKSIKSFKVEEDENDNDINTAVASKTETQTSRKCKKTKRERISEDEETVNKVKITNGDVGKRKKSSNINNNNNEHGFSEENNKLSVSIKRKMKK